MLGGSALVAVHEANAWSYMATDISEYCSTNGYQLLAPYQSNSCTACHKDNQAKSAYNNNNLEYFCSVPDTSTTCTDEDGDGFYVEGESCGTLADFDDTNSAAYPGAVEICTDGIDNDGNGLTDSADPNAVNCNLDCTDLDQDGYAVDGGACGAIDCNDNDASINPGAAEICSDSVDNNCNGLVDTADTNAVDCPLDCTDSDGDGYSIEGGSCGAVDCDDTDPNINPGALEICDDGVDNNCNGTADSADAVCHDSGSDDDQSDEPWWRSKGKHHHRQNMECDNGGAEEDGVSEGDDESSHNDESSEDDDHSGRRHSKRSRD
jgi:hypothetical protein